MTKQNILTLACMVMIGVFSITGCGEKLSRNGISVAYSSDKTASTAVGYTDSHGKMSWDDSQYDRDFEVQATNQQGTPLPNIHVQIFSGNNAAFAILIDPTFKYEPYITTVTNQLGGSVFTTSLNSSRLSPEDIISDITISVKVIATLVASIKTAATVVNISPENNLTPQDVQLLLATLVPSWSPNQFYDTKNDAVNALVNDFTQRAIHTALIFGSDCAAGTIGGAVGAGIGALPGCVMGLKVAQIESSVASIGGYQQIGTGDIATLTDGLLNFLSSNEPNDQRYTIADLQVIDFGTNLLSYAIQLPGGNAKIILSVDPDSISITPTTLAFNAIPDTQNVSVMARYTYFNQWRGPADYTNGRFFTITPTNIAQISYSSTSNDYEITKLLTGIDTITFGFHATGKDITEPLSISDLGAPPVPPTGVTAITGNTQVSLTWNPSVNAAGYYISYSTVSGGPYGYGGSTTNTNYTVTGLVNGTVYYFVVSAYNNYGVSDPSNEVSAMPQVPITTPNPPTGLSATAGNGQAALTWTASTSATSYNIYESTTSGGPYTKVASTAGTSYTVTGLIGTTYYFVVTAVNSNGESGYSSEVSSLPAYIINTYSYAGYASNDIAIDASGNIWISNYYSNNITELSPTGTTIGTYNVGTNPAGIAIDVSGNVWIVNNGSGNVTELSSTGILIGTYSVGTTAPGTIVIDPSGNIWVTSGPSGAVSKLSSTGSLIGIYSVGSSNGMSIDALGNIWVANGTSSSGFVTELNPTGTTIGTYNVSSSGSAGGVSIDSSGNVWVIVPSASFITKLSSTGITIGTYTVGNNLNSIVVDASGNVWVNNGSGNITELSPTGKIIGNYTLNGYDGRLAIDASGNVWVSKGGGSGTSSGVAEIVGITKGPRYFPYTGPIFPGGGWQ